MNDNAHKDPSTIIENTISIHNAGMVILNAYIPMLFERLGLISDKKFTSYESQINAAQLLQYLVSGRNNNDPAYLPLNRVLCGLPINHEIPSEVKISTENEQLMTGLINSAISHWDVIGQSSVDGFRGNWLIREGIINKLEDRWELRVNTKPYDILIGRSPYYFSIIKYPWMEKPLYVIWPY